MLDFIKSFFVCVGDFLHNPFGRIHASEGIELPRGYGVAYYDPIRNIAVLYPIPINLMVYTWRSFYFSLVNPPPSWVEVMEIKRDYSAWVTRRRKDASPV